MTPTPSRRKLDTAEKLLKRADDKYRKATDAIRDREEALRRERHELNMQRDAELAKLQSRLDDARSDYDRAMDAWRD